MNHRNIDKINQSHSEQDFRALERQCLSPRPNRPTSKLGETGRLSQNCKDLMHPNTLIQSHSDVDFIALERLCLSPKPNRPASKMGVTDRTLQNCKDHKHPNTLIQSHSDEDFEALERLCMSPKPNRPSSKVGQKRERLQNYEDHKHSDTFNQSHGEEDDNSNQSHSEEDLGRLSISACHHLQIVLHRSWDLRTAIPCYLQSAQTLQNLHHRRLSDPQEVPEAQEIHLT